jgi:hypothetical protein
VTNIRDRFESGEPTSEGQLVALEIRLGWELPASLRSFAKELGGAFIGGLLDGVQRYSILCYFDLGEFAEPDQSAENEYVEAGILPFARCELGGFYLLERDGRVRFRLVHSGKTTLETVADSYNEFEQRIMIEDEDVES